MNAHETLLEKIGHTYSADMEYWQTLEKDEIINLAEVIAAKKLIYTELQEGDFPDRAYDYLLQFKEPLEILSHKMVEQAYHGITRLQLSGILEHLCDTPLDTHVDYDMENALPDSPALSQY